jgi:hypothetical protein
MKLVSALLLCCGITHTYAQEPQLAGNVQSILMSALEPDAPSITLSQWLSRLGGTPSGGLKWEVNDCGEGGDGLEAPTCVEGRVSLGSGRVAAVSVAVVTSAGKAVGKPSIFMMYVRDGQNVEFAKTTRELELLVAKWRK